MANITVVSDIITPYKKKNGREEDRRQIPFNKNEENQSIIARGTIEPNSSKKNEQKLRNKLKR